MSPDEGHHHVLDAFSELRIAFGDGARFEWLLQSLAEADPVEETGQLSAVWDWRASAMALVNALCNSPDDLERRCEIRGELQRRGLFDALEVRILLVLYHVWISVDTPQSLELRSPPDNFNTQLSLFFDERTDDLADLRQLYTDEAAGPLSSSARMLLIAAEAIPRAVPVVEEVLRRCVAIFHTHTEEQVHFDRYRSRADATRSVLVDLLTVLAMFTEHLSDVSDV
jgi:diaphanous 1